MCLTIWRNKRIEKPSFFHAVYRITQDAILLQTMKVSWMVSPLEQQQMLQDQQQQNSVDIANDNISDNFNNNTNPTTLSDDPNSASNNGNNSTGSALVTSTDYT